MGRPPLPCKGCGTPKTPETFGTRVVGGRRYFTSHCRVCRKEGLNRYRLANPVNRLWSSCKSRAQQLGLAFSLTLVDLPIPDRCPVLDIPISVEVGKRSDNTASVDRIDPSCGYVVGNVRVISWRANRLKSNATPDELRRLAAYVSTSARPK